VQRWLTASQTVDCRLRDDRLAKRRNELAQ